VFDCTFPAEPGRSLCDAHEERFRVRWQTRHVSLETFVVEIRADGERAAGAYVLRPVDGALRLELQYLLQHERTWAGRSTHAGSTIWSHWWPVSECRRC
jgi:hypothetical protein